MRLITLALTGLLLLIQIPLWLGSKGGWLHVGSKGGWLHVWALEQQVAVAQKKNADLKARNTKLESEVRDLREGTGAIEERARFELGMIKEDEVFIQVVEPNAMPKPQAASTSTVTPALAAVKARR